MSTILRTMNKLLMSQTTNYLYLFIAGLSLLLTSCSTSDAVRVITSKHPDKVIEKVAKSHVHKYKHNPLVLARDVRSLLKTLKRKVDHQWGRKNRAIASSHRFVKYSQNYKSRAIINFDTGKIKIETVASKRPLKSLHNAIVTTLLTPDDPRSVDLYTDHVIELKGQPYLAGFVKNQFGSYISTAEYASRYASYLIKHHLKKRHLHVGNKNKTSRSVHFKMINNHADIRAQKYSGLVKHYAQRNRLSRSLVFAIIKTESNFNPYATSSAPAYGLMQLVPSTGGRDAFRFVKGEDRIPSRQYLFNARNNIELGTGYLNILNSRYLKDVQNPLSREYCMIAAYNTGAGNVLKAFHPNRDRATRMINSMTPPQVYRHLRRKLKHQEARRYLLKVTKAQRKFTRQ